MGEWLWGRQAGGRARGRQAGGRARGRQVGDHRASPYSSVAPRSKSSCPPRFAQSPSSLLARRSATLLARSISPPPPLTPPPLPSLPPHPPQFLLDRIRHDHPHHRHRSLLHVTWRGSRGHVAHRKVRTQYGIVGWGGWREGAVDSLDSFSRPFFLPPLFPAGRPAAPLLRTPPFHVIP